MNRPRRRKHYDPVTPEVYIAVMERDAGCVAVALGEPPDDCRGRLQADHVKDQPQIGDPPVKRKGPRAPSDLAHLVAVCEWHHLYGWATGHRPQLRDYLREKNA